MTNFIDIAYSCFFANQGFVFLLNDAPHYSQFGIQASGSPVLTAMISFHHYLMCVLTIIGICVFYLLGYIFYNFNSNKNPQHSIEKFSHSKQLEIGWTVLPAVVLLFLALPSFGLLYSLDETISSTLTVKVIGHQWYWSYEYEGFHEEDVTDCEFDSYMINAVELRPGMFKCLEVDNRLHVPVKTHIKVLVTSSDVLHSWAVPSLGIKIDACPGRISQISLYSQRNSTYYGQCSEICGVNHGFMPIVVTAEYLAAFCHWMAWQKLQ